MGILRLVVVGVAGVVAYKAWQKRQAAATGLATRDDGEVTPPHGDRLTAVQTPTLVTEPAVAAAQSSRGFGGEE
ncbi:hypothetical protein HF319_05895 [Xanthomonas sp. Kuri4-1]